MNLSLRGLCAAETKIMDGYFDKFYFAHGFVQGKPHWRGLGKSHIYYIPEAQTWRLESYYDRARYADYLVEDDNDPNAFFPTGRSMWRVKDGVCQLKDSPRALSLSNCIWNNGSGYDFTCATGRCIPIGQRCDLVDDCSDASDEADCSILDIGEDYRSGSFPILKSGGPVPVKINVTILSFAEINTVALGITVDFILLMKWSDPRLIFANLLDLVDLNSLSEQNMNQLWVPTLSFSNGRQAEGTVIDSGTRSHVQRSGKRLPDDFSMAIEGQRYYGKDSPIIMEREYFVTFSCYFKLDMYPFDTQVLGNKKLHSWGKPQFFSIAQNFLLLVFFFHQEYQP
jgi:hypothetical protein